MPEGLSVLGWFFFISFISMSNKIYYLSLQMLPYLLEQLPPGYKTLNCVWNSSVRVIEWSSMVWFPCPEPIGKIENKVGWTYSTLNILCIIFVPYTPTLHQYFCLSYLSAVWNRSFLKQKCTLSIIFWMLSQRNSNSYGMLDETFVCLLIIFLAAISLYILLLLFTTSEIQRDGEKENPIATE